MIDDGERTKRVPESSLSEADRSSYSHEDDQWLNWYKNPRLKWLSGLSA